MNWEEQGAGKAGTSKTLPKITGGFAGEFLRYRRDNNEKKNTCGNESWNESKRISIGNPKQSALELQLDEAGQAMIRCYLLGRANNPPVPNFKAVLASRKWRLEKSDVSRISLN